MPAGAPWRRSTAATAYINDLLSCTPHEVAIGGAEGGRVLVYQLAKPLTISESRTSPNLVVTPNVHHLWTNVLHTNDREYHNWVVIGSPGVGKSRSAWHFLRMYVDERRATVADGIPMPIVAFEHRGDGNVWMFEPADANNGHTEYNSNTCGVSEFHADRIDFLRSSDNLFIVDSANTSTREGPPPTLQCPTVFISRPVPAHYKEFVDRASAAFMGPACADSLVAAAPYMTAPTKRVSEADVRARVAKVGPLPRRIFSKVRYNEALAKITMAFAYTKNVQRAEGIMRSGTWSYETAVYFGIEPLSTIFMLQPDNDGQLAQPVLVSDYARSLIRSDLAGRVYASLQSRQSALANMIELRTTMKFLTYRFMQSGQWRPKLVPHPSHANLTPTIAIGGNGGGGVELTKPPWESVYQRLAKLPWWSTRRRESAPPADPVFLGSDFPVVDAMDACNRGFHIAFPFRKQWGHDTVQQL